MQVYRMDDGHSIILTTTRRRAQAEALAEKILEQKLAACIQIQKTKSFYSWHEKIERSEEYLLLIKTRTILGSKLSEFIRQNHDYQIPEIVQIPISDGSPEYLSWISAVTDDLSL
ncbi:MAG: divalent-cation tolerance protein CutA [Holosporaceae bacterium]|jgi:periplasmic divalent cation tolerance protein|nr:divalent-cation tolerance protein CutA [Holosporaceae bacterium]